MLTREARRGRSETNNALAGWVLGWELQWRTDLHTVSLLKHPQMFEGVSRVNQVQTVMRRSITWCA